MRVPVYGVCVEVRVPEVERTNTYREIIVWEGGTTYSVLIRYDIAVAHHIQIGMRGWFGPQGFIPDSDTPTEPRIPVATKKKLSCHRCGPGDFEYAEPNTMLNGEHVFICRSCRQNPYR